MNTGQREKSSDLITNRWHDVVEPAVVDFCSAIAL